MFWPFRKKHLVVAQHEPPPIPGDGWHDWCYSSPYAHDRVEAMRHDWAEPKTLSPRELHPMMNVSGLYWRELP